MNFALRIAKRARLFAELEDEMASRRLFRSWTAALAAAVSLLGVTSSKSAVIVAGFGPTTFDSPISGAGFAGNARFLVPDACLSLTGVIQNANACSSGAMILESASLQIYEVPTNNPVSAFSFTGASIPMNSIEVAGGQVTAADTPFLFDPFVDPLIQGFTGNLSLRFVIDNSPGGAGSGVNLLICPTGDDCFQQRAGARFVNQVPEPAPLALAGLAGLMALGVIRRRRA